MSDNRVALASLTWQGKMLALLASVVTLVWGVCVTMRLPYLVLVWRLSIPLPGLAVFFGGWMMLGLFGVPVFKPDYKEKIEDREFSWRRVGLLLLAFPLVVFVLMFILYLMVAVLLR